MENQVNNVISDMKEVRLFAVVKTHAKFDQILSIDGTHFVVSVKAAPIDGKANDAVIRLIARYLHIPVTLIRLKSGIKAKNKVFILSS